MLAHRPPLLPVLALFHLWQLPLSPQPHSGMAFSADAAVGASQGALPVD
jgi:hypothetical protein